MIDNFSSAFDLNDYDTSYTEFSTWVVDNDMSVYAIAAVGGTGGKYYFFEHLEDFTAFTLKFSKRLSSQVMRYKGKSSVDAGAYYAPYIPITK